MMTTPRVVLTSTKRPRMAHAMWKGCAFAFRICAKAIVGAEGRSP